MCIFKEQREFGIRDVPFLCWHILDGRLFCLEKWKNMTILSDSIFALA